MPNASIDRAIKRASGEGSTDVYEEIFKNNADTELRFLVSDRDQVTDAPTGVLG